MLTNGRGVSRRLCGQGRDRAVMPRCGPKLLKQPNPGSRANWNRKDRGDMAACRRERTTGTGPLPASAARFPPAELPCLRSTYANPPPAARNYFPALSRKVLRGSRAGIDERRARSMRPEEWDDGSDRYKCRAAWGGARAVPARGGWIPGTGRQTLRLFADSARSVQAIPRHRPPELRGLSRATPVHRI